MLRSICLWAVRTQKCGLNICLAHALYDQSMSYRCLTIVLLILPSFLLCADDKPVTSVPKEAYRIAQLETAKAKAAEASKALIFHLYDPDSR